MTPKDRAELIELMARAICNANNLASLAPFDELPEGTQEHALTMALSALAVLESHGLAIVPVEATEGMLDATVAEDGSVLMPWRYSAMLSASPFKETVEYEPGAIR